MLPTKAAIGGDACRKTAHGAIFGQLIDHADQSRFAVQPTPPKDDEKQGEAPEAHRTVSEVSRGKPHCQGPASLPRCCSAPGAASAQSTVTIGIGTQDTTTNTVTAGTIIRELKLLEKHLPKDGKYANIKFRSSGRTSPRARPSPTA